ncbi:hypothetical protein AVEN_156788-1 [Araneus ventricosus]|uniref:Uncharacterized protein n=1 Tax=Araneus ventricosus TaxID=182803 RepID=A0A4Y2R0A1_ARAVE|nr:hypothetical protein AVEN_156788-1 [Araneus ventricosus]
MLISCATVQGSNMPQFLPPGQDFFSVKGFLCGRMFRNGIHLTARSTSVAPFPSVASPVPRLRDRLCQHCVRPLTSIHRTIRNRTVLPSRCLSFVYAGSAQIPPRMKAHAKSGEIPRFLPTIDLGREKHGNQLLSTLGIRMECLSDPNITS